MTVLGVDIMNDYTVAAYFLVTGVALAALWIAWWDSRMRIRELEEREAARWGIDLFPGENDD